MAKRQNKNLLVGLDIGTSKVVSIIAEVGYDGVLTIIGIGSHPSKGLKKGVVVDIAENVSKDSYPQIFIPRKKAMYIIETLAGVCNKHNITKGIKFSTN